MQKIARFIAAGILALTAMALQPSYAQMKIERLADDNCMIRVSDREQSKYLLLPVDENCPESVIHVIADNQEQRTIQVRFSQGKIDYHVPFDLDEFRGKELVLATHLNFDRSGREGVGPDVLLEKVRLSDTFDCANTERFRPAFHHTPQYGWMNDPNGMFFLDGTYHLYYQYNPYASVWGNMSWGHSTSTDLIHWKHEDVAISPDAFGWIFSGSCVVDKDNTAGFGKGAVVAMYTNCYFDCGDVQVQALSYSNDGGRTFSRYEGNPVLTAELHDFRDPKMFWNEDIQAWNLIVSAKQEMRIYSSPDLKNWTEESRFGEGVGCHAGMWECPDLLKIDDKWVLVCNINPGGPSGGSATQYFIGDFDGHTFTVDDPSRYSDGKALWMDYGKDHYATVSFSNAPEGRHIVMAWMSNWEYARAVPTLQYRSSNSIARDLFLYKAGDEYFLGCRPAAEYDGKGLDRTFKLSGSETVTLANPQGDEFRIIYDQKAMTLTCDRSKCGDTGFSEAFPASSTAPVHRKLKSIRVFVDECSVEVFGNDGEVVLTNLVFPQSRLKWPPVSSHTAPSPSTSSSPSTGNKNIISLQTQSLVR